MKLDVINIVIPMNVVNKVDEMYGIDVVNRIDEKN